MDKLAVNIQAVRQKDAIIAEVRSAEFCGENASIERLEHARTELRGIMKYRQQKTGPGYETGTTSTFRLTSVCARLKSPEPTKPCSTVAD